MAVGKLNQDIAFIAKTNFRGKDRIFGIQTKDRRQHVYVIGKTGTGKTTLIKNMVLQDIRNGSGVGIIDPHGEFVEDVLEHIPAERTNDVVYFNPVDAEYPIGFNVLEVPDMKYKHLVVSDLLGIFTKIWANVWSARMEYILQNCIMALLDTPGTTLLGVPRLLVDKDYRQKIVSNVKDPVVRSFWVHEYETWRDQFRNEAIVPIQNKVNQFLNTSFIRNIIGQPTSSLNVSQIMNEGKILLVNVSKGKVGEDNSALLGAMIITKVQLAAMERVRIAEEERKDFYLYVDEFQNFATDSFASILSEARKYRLNLIIAHQYVGQLVTDVSTKVRDAVFGNVGTMITFRVGAGDAEYLEKEFSPEFMQPDLINLPNFNVYLKLMVDGLTSRPFSATTLPALKFETDPEIKGKIIKASRERYARPREEVEAKIAQWSGMGGMGEGGGVMGGETTEFDAICWNCGKKTTVPFKPDGKRPVYCLTCLKQIEGGTLIPLPERMPQVGRARFAGSLENLGIEFADGGVRSPAGVRDPSTMPRQQRRDFSGESIHSQAVSPQPVSMGLDARREPAPFRSEPSRRQFQQPVSAPPVQDRRSQQSFSQPAFGMRRAAAPFNRGNSPDQSASHEGFFKRNILGAIRSRPVVKIAPGAKPVSLAALKPREGFSGDEAAHGEKSEIKKRERASVDAVGLKELLQQALAGKSKAEEKKTPQENESKTIEPGEKVKF